jgi:thioredoxin reductase (NADPH)
MEVTDVVIVGCGPAGMAAAIQLTRAGLKPVVFEKQRVGGLLVNACLVENYPGFPEGVSGIDLVALMRRHLTGLGINVVHEEVTAVHVDGGMSIVETGAGRVLSRIVVVASGTKPRELPSVAIPEDLGERFSYEIDAIRAVRGRRVAIVGAGDAAFDYALSLERHNHVTILSRGHEPRCLDLLWQRARMSPRISYMPETAVVEIRGVPGRGLTLACRSAGGAVDVTADRLVIAIGRDPELGFLSKAPAAAAEARRKQGFLHLIGDVRNGSMRQTAIAVGDGMTAAMMIAEKLRENAR